MSSADAPAHIVVGVDGTETSMAALRWALSHARGMHARVEAVMAYEIPMYVYVAPTATEADFAGYAQELLDRIISEARDAEPDVALEARIEPSAAGPCLTRASRGADLLVVGTHGHGQIPGMYIGSVATYCVHHAACPVVVYRTPAM